MQLIRSFEHEDAAQVGFGIRVLLLSAELDDGPIAGRLAGLGSKIEHAQEIYAGLAAMIDDPAGYGLFVLDCDSFGGIEAGRKAVLMLDDTARRIPVILVSRDCGQQSFPEERGTPTILRAPLSAVSMRVGFEHALRDRLATRLM